MRLEEFIETQNAFEVMARFRKEGILTREDINRAVSMDREEWVKFMKERARVQHEA